MIQGDYITKEYFDQKLDQKLEQLFQTFSHTFATKKDLELMKTDFEHKVTDLSSGFNEKVKGVCDQVLSIDQKITRIEKRVIDMDEKLTIIGADVFYVKSVLPEKTDKKDTLSLKRRVIRLESKIA